MHVESQQSAAQVSSLQPSSFVLTDNRTGILRAWAKQHLLPSMASSGPPSPATRVPPERNAPARVSAEGSRRNAAEDRNDGKGKRGIETATAYTAVRYSLKPESCQQARFSSGSLSVGPAVLLCTGSCSRRPRPALEQVLPEVGSIHLLPVVRCRVISCVRPSSFTALLCALPRSFHSSTLRRR